MESPETLSQCMDIAIITQFPIKLIILSYNLDFPDFEIEGLLAERVAKITNPKELLGLNAAAPSADGFRRIVEKAKRSMKPRKELDPKTAQSAIKAAASMLELVCELKGVERPIKSVSESEKNIVRRCVESL